MNRKPTADELPIAGPDGTRSKKRRRKWPWLIVAVPTGLIVLALAGATLRYGFATVQQAAILGYTLIFPYTPSAAPNTFVGPWTYLPEPRQHIGHLRIATLGIDLPIVQGTYAHQTAQVGHFAGSTLPGQGSDAILVTENPTLRKAGSLRPGTVIQWVAPQGVFAYRVQGSAPIQSLSNLSGVNRESLALVEQSTTRKGKTQLFAIFASPEFSSK